MESAVAQFLGRYTFILTHNLQPPSRMATDGGSTTGMQWQAARRKRKQFVPKITKQPPSDDELMSLLGGGGSESAERGRVNTNTCVGVGDLPSWGYCYCLPLGSAEAVSAEAVCFPPLSMSRREGRKSGGRRVPTADNLSRV
eukprot:scaffold8826_cov117-Isochrysis_galbana.AAC.6